MIKVIDSILWSIAIVFITYCGIYYTYKLRLVQFRFRDIFTNIFKKSEDVAPFSALMVSLGGKIGVGSIAGISLAIYLGGIGTVFWIWVIGLLCAPNVFAETVLGIRYQNKSNYTGGPSSYLKDGLGLKKISRLYSYLIIFSYIGGFLSIQSNTIAISLQNYVKPLLTGVIVGILSLIIILGGIKKITQVSKILVPLMIIIYFVFAMYIVVGNIASLPYLFCMIVKSALDIKSLGFGVISTFIIGVQRGIFANEAGLGTGAIAAAMVKTKYPAECGFVQMMGVYITTFLVCTTTSLLVISSRTNGLVTNGIESVRDVFICKFGSLGNLIVTMIIIMFAFSTILSGYYDGEASLVSISNPSKFKMFLFKLITFIIIIVGSICQANLLWNIVNILTALLAIINSYAIYQLHGDVAYELERYDKYDKMK